MQEKVKRALNARRIAVVGASQEQLSIGMGPVYNLLSAGFQGEVFPVNPKYDQILGQKCFPDIEAINPPPDLAILMLNPHLAIEMAERAGKHGVGAVTIVVGGFGELRCGGENLDVQLKDIAQRYEMPVIGPNTLGFSCLHRGLNGLFWHFAMEPGKVALISQSGGVGLTIAFNLQEFHCGLSHFIGVGNRTVLDFGDYLQALEDDPFVGAYVLFIEGVVSPRSLFEPLKKAALSNPVIVYKAGKNEQVSKATATHTGSLAGEYRLYRSMFKQAGAFEVDSSREAAIAAKALSTVAVPRGKRLCALTFTAGPCIVAMDKLIGNGWELPDLSPECAQTVRSIIGQNTPVDLQNPVDLTGPGFLAKNYVPVLQRVMDEDFDAYLLIWSFTPLIRMPVVEIEAIAKKYPSKSVVLVILGHSPRDCPLCKGTQSEGNLYFYHAGGRRGGS